VRPRTGPNPLRRAERLAADRIAAFLARDPDAARLEESLIDLAENTVQKGTQGFLRVDAEPAATPRLQPTWVPTAPAALVDRLAAAGLVRRDGPDGQWIWTDSWTGAHLAYRSLLRGEPEEQKDRLDAWLSWAKTRTATEAIGLLADAWIRDRQISRLRALLERERGCSALALAVALHAPAQGADALEPFDALLDELFGPPRAFQPAPIKLGIAKVLDRAAVRLADFESLAAARLRLLRRLSALLESAVELYPRRLVFLRSLASCHLTLAETEDTAGRALLARRRALRAWRRTVDLASEDPWAATFLQRYCAALIGMAPEGLPHAEVHEAYAEALAARERFGTREPDREQSLRDRVMLAVRILELGFESSTTDRVDTYRRALEWIDELLELEPGNEGYRQARRELLERLARELEPTDPGASSQLREQIRNLDGPRSAEADPASTSSGAPMPGAGPTQAESSTSPERSAAAVLPVSAERLRIEIREAQGCSLADPVRAIALSTQIVEAICRSLVVSEMGALAGEPRLSQLAEWLFANARLPERFRQVFVVLDWHEGLSLAELRRSGAIGSVPGVHCCAAMLRLARWYFENQLRVELPAELETLRPAPTLETLAPGTEGGVSLPAHALSDPRGIGTHPEPPLHHDQLEAALRLGVPPWIDDERTGIRLVLIPGATVPLGPQPAAGARSHRPGPAGSGLVRIRPFYCGISPVLQEQWTRLVASNPSRHPGPRLPVANLTPEVVAEYLEGANRGRSGPGLRLPLDVEWQLAARAGTTTAFWWGPEYRMGWANCSEDGIGSGMQEPSVPGAFPPNPYGLFDVVGNVRELCRRSQPPLLPGTSRVDPWRGPAAAEGFALCGCSWLLLPTSFEIGELTPYHPELSRHDVGFRCVRDAS